MQTTTTTWPGREMMLFVMSQKVSYQKFQEESEHLTGPWIQSELNFTTVQKLLWPTIQTVLQTTCFNKSSTGIVFIWETFPLHMQLRVHRQDCNMCSRATSCSVPLNYQPSVRLDACDLKRPPSRVRKSDVQMLRALPRGYTQMFATSDCSAQFSVFLQSDVRDTCRKWEPPICSWWRQRADRLRGHAETQKKKRKLESFQKRSTFFFKWVTMTDDSELAGCLVSHPEELLQIIYKNLGETKQRGPASKANSRPVWRRRSANRHHMVWRLRNGELASTRPQNHGSVIKHGVNMELHRTSQCGTVGDPPHVACFSYLNTGRC